MQLSSPREQFHHTETRKTITIACRHTKIRLQNHHIINFMLKILILQFLTQINEVKLKSHITPNSPLMEKISQINMSLLYKKDQGFHAGQVGAF